MKQITMKTGNGTMVSAIGDLLASADSFLSNWQDYRGVKFHQPAKIGHWWVSSSCVSVLPHALPWYHRGVIVFDSERGDGRRGSGMPRQDTENLMGQLVRACKDYGMAVANERFAW